VSAIRRPGERQALTGFLDGVAEESRALLLEGEPGIGKSTLWSEGVDLAKARGHVVLPCRPTGADAELSFLGLGDLLRDLPRAVVEGLPDPQRVALEVSLLRRPASRRRPDPHAVSLSALAVVRSLAADGSLVVAIDDVQWLDDATARVLAFVARRLGQARVGFLLTRTDHDAPLPLGLHDALPATRVMRLIVPPASAVELRALVRDRVGLTLSVSESKRLRQVCGGNPFFALEIAYATARGDRGVTGQSLPIPTSLREDLVRKRLGSLPPSSAELLLVTAAAGRASLDLLRLAGGGASTRTRLQHAIDAGFLQVAGSEVRFTHPIYRSAIYAHASRARRHAVHRRLADLTDDLEGRARHLALSADGSDEAIAAVLDEAAAAARERGAPGSAGDLVDHAIRLTPPTSVENLHRRHLAAADHRLVAGDLEQAATHADTAVRTSRPGVERAVALRRVAAVELERGAIGNARRSLEHAEREAVAEALVAVEVQRDLAELALDAGDLTAAERSARSVAEAAERSGDPTLRAAARATLLRIGVLRGEAEQILASSAPPDPPVGNDPAEIGLILADAEIVMADHPAARARLEALREDAVRRGDEPDRRVLLMRLADLELRDGDWDRSESLAREARTMAEQVGVARGVETGILAYLLALRGRADEARAEAADGIRLATEDRRALLWTLGALGHLELSLGTAEVALRHLGRAGGILTEMNIGEPAAFPFVPDEIEALVSVGEHALADRRISWLEDRGAALGRTSAVAAAERSRALLVAETGDLSDALGHAERAMELSAGLPLPFDRGRALLVLGTLRRRDRRKRASREALDAATELFEGLGASIWAERTRAELMRISGRRASLTTLTESEQRVVRLAASGLTNREIARTLSMSVRTVEGHLSHTYRKLGLRSRTELAVFFDPSE
jgi:DNA-binding CsgD family transcriptional regulator